MHIGILLPYMKAGGTERQARYISRHLRASGHTVTIIVAEAEGIFLKEVEEETVSLNVPFSKLNAPLLVYHLLRIVWSLDLDLLLSRAWNTNMVAAAAGLITNTPYVLFLSGPSDRTGQPHLKLAVEGFLLSRAARIIAVSEAARENCIQAYDLPSSQVAVVHNGIKIDEIQALADQHSTDVDRMSSDAYNVAFVGRINHRKGLDVLLRAVNLGCHRRPDSKTVEMSAEDEPIDIQVWVVGSGDVGTYQQLAEELHIADRVHFLGEKENPFPEMKAADLFVLPSRSEGFPNVLLEAMALGRPVLAADCKTGPNEVVDGENGLLFPVEDHRTLARLMKELAGADQKRDAMGQRAQETVQKYLQLDTQLSRIEQILEKAAAEHENE
jgi:glycosyltransferase involved in cell wall biosynthesis